MAAIQKIQNTDTDHKPDGVDLKALFFHDDKLAHTNRAGSG
jgi:hypothetical protein